MRLRRDRPGSFQPTPQRRARSSIPTAFASSAASSRRCCTRALGGADPLKVARDAGARVRHVHLKDVDGPLAARVRAGSLSYNDAVRAGLFRPLGEGAARIEDVLGELRKVGYAGWYVLEQDVMLDREPAPRPPEWIARSTAYARKHG